MKKIVLLVVLISVFSACKKSSNNNNNTNNNNTNNTPVAGQYGTPFTGVPAAKDIVMYEVNIRAFSPADNFAGVEARLDSIKALGVNVIWLMPTYPIGQVKSFGSPYCVQNDTLVNSEFGTLGDLRTFVSMAHNLGMAVILDWVTDGTSWDNVWITNSSWYDLNSSGMIEQYGTYTDIAKLNYANTTMQAAQIYGMEFWLLQANIDGYRCDNADSEPDAFWTTAISNISTLGHKLILLAEGSSTTHFASGFQMIYGWDYFSSLMNVFDQGSAAQILQNTNIADAPASGNYYLRFTSNHDEDLDTGTPDSLFGGSTQSSAGAMAAFVLASTMGGVPLIYDGQEVGCNTKLQFFNTSTVIDWSANTNISGAYEQVIAFRSANDAVKEGATTYLGTSNRNISAFEKTIAGDTALVIVNVRNATETYTPDASIQNTTWLDALNSNASYTISAGNITLQPYQYMLLKKQ